MLVAEIKPSKHFCGNVRDICLISEDAWPQIVLLVLPCSLMNTVKNINYSFLFTNGSICHEFKSKLHE